MFGLTQNWDGGVMSFHELIDALLISIVGGSVAVETAPRLQSL